MFCIFNFILIQLGLEGAKLIMRIVEYYQPPPANSVYEGYGLCWQYIPQAWVFWLCNVGIRHALLG